ncbi:antibiotic biosynthesis monooxygenase [Methylobacterium variabile]|jgi:quinol monooxygenase YgiN|uniref:Antibiotic biosynthesis monooxygenase n=1 Tax=Methylobacterium variabile TaxID=298794 RepID=A0A0J6VNE9_9HYPH|nr:putative quinol monooxygenase [Methylobacterium variabile]KMO40731.1 antibiotic biosynthesis monooxygenase [Methylobacterium variabile]
MTVPVVAIFVAKPGAEARLEALFRSVIPATLAEAGCISYQLNRDLDDPRRFVWTEEWASRQALEQHLAAPHIAALFAQLPEHVESSQVIALGRVAGGRA